MDPDPFRRRAYRLIAEYSGIIFLIPSSFLAGWLLGYWLDEYFQTSPILSVIFLLLGGVAGLFETFRLLSRHR